MSPASLSSIFNGRTNPTNNHVQAIHRAFPVVNVSWLMFGEGDMFVPPAGQDGVNPLTGKPFGGDENSVVSVRADGIRDDALATDVEQSATLDAVPESGGDRQAAFTFPQDAGTGTVGVGSLAGEVVSDEVHTAPDLQFGKFAIMIGVPLFTVVVPENHAEGLREIIRTVMVDNRTTYVLLMV